MKNDSCVRNLVISVVTLLMSLAFALPALAIDSDGDGVDDLLDNCPTLFNSEQVDSNGDGVGDACTLSHCVKNSSEFQSALSEAQSNNKYNMIMLEQGTYRLSESNNRFTFDSSGPYGVSIVGGYSDGCNSRNTLGENTVLDGSATSNQGILGIFSTSPLATAPGKILVEGITFKRGGGGQIDERDYVFNGREMEKVVHGGGLNILTSTGSVTLKNNIITDSMPGCTLGFYDEICTGGGIYVHTEYGNIELTENQVSNNSTRYTSGSGGGAFLKIEYAGNITVSKNIIKNNQSYGFGGGIYMDLPFVGSVNITNNIISDNVSIDRGGGGIALMGLDYGSFNNNNSTIINNVISNNSNYNSSGGGIYIYSDSINMINNTVVNNYSYLRGGGIELHSNNVSNLYNNIIWGNTRGNSGSGNYYPHDSFLDAGSGIINFYNNDYDSSKTGPSIPANQANNLSADPLFVNPAAKDYHIKSTSPLINKANNSAPSLPAIDYEGNHRIIGGIVDIGADEYNPITASFAVTPASGVAPLTVNFTNTSTSAAASVVSWAWDLNNDGMIDSVLQNPSFVYTNLGRHKISLTAADANGNTDTESGYVLVDYDSDNDGVIDSYDNCPHAYNPLQVDLNGNGVGDACEGAMDFFAQATFATGLSTATDREIYFSDVTATMKDGLLSPGIRALVSGKRNDVISFRSNVDASKLSTAILNLYVNSLYQGKPQSAKIYPYVLDGTYVEPSQSISVNLSSGWNRLNLTPILHVMDGLGFVKYRVTAARNWFDISEASFIELADDREIGATPSVINFGSVAVGNSPTSTITVSNNGTGNLTVASIIAPPSPFSVTADECTGITLAAKASCTLRAAFTPISLGAFSDSLTILTNDADHQTTPITMNGVAIRPSSILSGIITGSPASLPLPDVNVTITDSLGLLSTATNSSGVYTIYGVAQGTFAASFEKGGFIRQFTSGIMSGSQTTLDILLQPVPPLTLTVTSPQDTSVVTSSPITVSGDVSNNANVTVNGINSTVQNGIYTAPIALAEGANNIAVIATDQYNQTASRLLSVTLVTKGTLAGRVTHSATSQPVSSATIMVIDSANVSHTATTDGAGAYSITDVKEGVFTGSISASGYQPREISGTMFPAQTVSADWALVSLFPTISAVTVANSTANSVQIKWVTDQQSSSLIEYGESTEYGGSANDPLLMTSHIITLTGLQPSTTYHFRVSSTNGNGFTASTADATFITPLFTAKTTGDVGNVTVMEVTGNYDGNKGDGSVNDIPRQEIAKEYFRTHPDTADFFVIFSNFDYAIPEAEAKGFYLGAKNDTQGIGQSIFDNTAQFGSAGKLQGTIDLGNVSILAANPYGPKLDETVNTLNHEIGHRWGSFMRFKKPDGTLNNSLLGEAGVHWSYLLDTQGSIMYGNGWKDNKDGTFTATAAMSGYSPLDLYLMGMIPKEQVPPMLLIDNAAIDKTQLPQLGVIVSGTAKTVTIDDIIAAEGARVPDASQAPKQFKVGFVLVTRPGDNATTAAAAIETLRSAWAGRFAELTRGVGSVADVPASLTVNIDTPADGATVTGPDITVSGTVINSTGAETGVVINGMPATISGSRFIVNHVPLQNGSNTLTITATDANGLTTTATRSVTAQAGHYLRISSNIDSGTGPLDISLRLDGSFVFNNPTVSIAGPVSVSPTPGSSPTEFTAKLNVEGTYTVTASATGPDGSTYTDSTTVTVVSKYQLETLLKGKWEGMKARITAGDVENTVQFFVSTKQQDYQDTFTEVGAALPQLASYMNPVELEYMNDDMAKCRMTRTEVISGQPQAVEYVVYFIRENGTWKLRDF